MLPTARSLSGPFCWFQKFSSPKLPLSRTSPWSDRFGAWSLSGLTWLRSGCMLAPIAAAGCGAQLLCGEPFSLFVTLICDTSRQTVPNNLPRRNRGPSERPLREVGMDDRERANHIVELVDEA